MGRNEDLPSLELQEIPKIDTRRKPLAIFSTVKSSIHYKFNSLFPTRNHYKRLKNEDKTPLLKANEPSVPSKIR